MVIKPFKVAPKVAENLVATLWESMLEPAVDAVFSQRESVAASSNNNSQQRISKEELYRAVEDICLQKQAAEVGAWFGVVLRSAVLLSCGAASCCGLQCCAAVRCFFFVRVVEACVVLWL